MTFSHTVFIFMWLLTPLENVSAGDVYIDVEFAGQTVLMTYTLDRWSGYRCKGQFKVIQKKSN